jgi:hypothetical protein
VLHLRVHVFVHEAVGIASACRHQGDSPQAWA